MPGVEDQESQVPPGESQVGGNDETPPQDDPKDVRIRELEAEVKAANAKAEEHKRLQSGADKHSKDVEQQLIEANAKLLERDLEIAKQSDDERLSALVQRVHDEGKAVLDEKLRLAREKGDLEAMKTRYQELDQRTTLADVATESKVDAEALKTAAKDLGIDLENKEALIKLAGHLGKKAVSEEPQPPAGPTQDTPPVNRGGPVSPAGPPIAGKDPIELATMAYKKTAKT